MWTKEMDEEFQEIKQATSCPPFLAFPDFDKPFIVDTDASWVGVGAVTAQEGGMGWLTLCGTLSGT